MNRSAYFLTVYVSPANVPVSIFSLKLLTRIIFIGDVAPGESPRVNCREERGAFEITAIRRVEAWPRSTESFRGRSISCAYVQTSAASTYRLHELLLYSRSDQLRLTNAPHRSNTL